MYASLMHSDKIGSMNWHKDIKNAWTENNTNTNIPRLSNGADDYANAASDRFLTSNSYLSLEQYQLGLQVPEEVDRENQTDQPPYLGSSRQPGYRNRT